MTKGDKDTSLGENVFRIREHARLRPRRTGTPLPSELLVNPDGSAVVAYDDGLRLSRFETLCECLLVHDLRALDLEPVD